MARKLKREYNNTYEFSVQSNRAAYSWTTLIQLEGTRSEGEISSFLIVYITMSHMCRPPHKALVSRMQMEEKHPKPVGKEEKPQVRKQ